MRIKTEILGRERKLQGLGDDFFLTEKKDIDEIGIYWGLTLEQWNCPKVLQSEKEQGRREQPTIKEEQEIRSILMLTFQSGVRVRAYAPFLEKGQVIECPAVIYSDLSGEYHSYKGTATVGYGANNAFLARLKDGRETHLSIGIIGACHWNEKDRLEEQKL